MIQGKLSGDPRETHNVRLVIMLTPSEKAALVALCQRRHPYMPLSSAARNLLMKLAEQVRK